MILLVFASILTAVGFGISAIILSIKEEKIEKLLVEREEKLKKRVYEISLLKEIQDRVGYYLDVEKVIDVITGSLGNLLELSTASSLMIKDNKLLFKSYPKEEINRIFLEQVKNSMLTSLRTIIPSNLPTTIEESIATTVLETNQNLFPASFMHIPFIINNKIIGLLNVSSIKPNLYKEEEVGMVYQLVNQAANALSKLENVLSNEKGKLMAMIGSLADGVFMVDVNNQLTLINNAALVFLTIQKAKPTIIDVLSSLPKDYDIEGKMKLAVSQNRMVEEKEVRLGDKTFQVFITPVLNPLASPSDASQKVLGASVLLHDISLEKNLAQMKEDFTNMMVHELRAPLTAMKDSAELLVDDNLTKDESNKLLDIIRDESKKLLMQVTSILDAAKLEAGRFSVEKSLANLNTVITQKLEFFYPQAKSKHIQLISHIPTQLPEFFFDDRYIAEVLDNLLSNSLKFTPNGGKIIVSAFIEDKRVLVSVTDSGIGIPKEKQSQLFSKFSQLNQDKHVSSTGLGLYISKGIIEAHGGSIAVSSELGHGTTVSFHIPLENPRPISESDNKDYKYSMAN